MKVFIVIGHMDYEYDDILKVFSSEESAKKYRDLIAIYFHEVSVEAYDIED